MSAQTYENGVLIEEWDDTTRTHTDYRTDPPTTRPYTEQENAEADQSLASAASLTDLTARVEALEAWRAALEQSAEPETPDPADPTIPTWADLAPPNVWPNGTLLVDLDTVWRNVSGVPLTTPPSGFPGDPNQWVHLFVAVTTPPDPEPTHPAWSPDSVAYAVGDQVEFEGAVYICIQAHTSQAGWTPSVVPSLWTLA